MRVAVVVGHTHPEEVLAALAVRVVAGLVLEQPQVRQELLTQVAAVAAAVGGLQMVALAVQA